MKRWVRRHWLRALVAGFAFIVMPMWTTHDLHRGWVDEWGEWHEPRPVWMQIATYGLLAAALGYFFGKARGEERGFREGFTTAVCLTPEEGQRELERRCGPPEDPHHGASNVSRVILGLDRVQASVGRSARTVSRGLTGLGSVVVFMLVVGAIAQATGSGLGLVAKAFSRWVTWVGPRAAQVTRALVGLVILSGLLWLVVADRKRHESSNRPTTREPELPPPEALRGSGGRKQT